MERDGFLGAPYKQANVSRLLLNPSCISAYDFMKHSIPLCS